MAPSSRKPLLHFFVFLSFLSLTTSEEVFENSTAICNRCTCIHSADNSVLSVNCSNKNLHHTLAAWPVSNATIIEASFVDNNITSLETLPPTDAVLEVSFSKCNIQFIYPGFFSNAKNTKVADLSHNRLTAEEMTNEKLVGHYADAKFEPVKLEVLSLAYNQIHSLHKDVFDHMPNLKRLNLEGNDFKVLDLHTQLALSSLKNLVSLNLAENELTELVKGAIEGYKHLTELDLSKNLMDFVPDELNLLGETLEVLNLDGNPIIEITNNTFSGMNNIIELSANNLRKLHRIEAKSFTPLSKLKTLSLSNNIHLKTIDENAFGPNMTLLELYLNDNNLTTINHTMLSWSNLHILDLKENPLECTCDLYNISSALSRDITRTTVSPLCRDPRDNRRVPVYNLHSDICSVKIAMLTTNRGHYIRHHFSIPLAGLVAVLIFALFIALSLAYNRYRRFLRNKNPAFASEVLYNPLSTTGGRF